MDRQTLADLLLKASERITDGNWCQDDYHKLGDLTDEEFVDWWQKMRREGKGGNIEQDMLAMLESGHRVEACAVGHAMWAAHEQGYTNRDLAMVMTMASCLGIPEFNDAVGRTADEVKQHLRELAEDMQEVSGG